MRGKPGTASLDHRAPIRLKGVRRIVQSDSEQHPDHEIRKSVDSQLQPGIVNYASAFHKAGPEYRLPALVEELPVANDVAAVVRFIGHHNHHRVAAKAL